ncbi:MAG TPA: prepilin peptidase [Chloroflexota bacterium]
MQLPEFSILPVIAVIAAVIALVTDVRSRRIPNWLTGSTLLFGLAANAYVSGVEGAVSSLAGAALGLAILLPFYMFGTMGAGDVKLLAAFGAVVGPHLLISIAVYAAIVGGIQSLIVLRRLGRVSLTLHQLFFMRVLPSRSGAKAPYAVALTGGLCLALAHPLALTL